MTSMSPPSCRRDRGAADALGLVLIAPVAIGLAVLVVMLGRGVDARAQVRSAAAAGAQAAALETDRTAADRAARAVITAMLVDSDACRSPGVEVAYPTGSASAPSIAFGTVRVTVRCGVSGRGLELVGGGSRTETFTATAPVDLFRVRAAP